MPTPRSHLVQFVIALVLLNMIVYVAFFIAYPSYREAKLRTMAEEVRRRLERIGAHLESLQSFPPARLADIRSEELDLADTFTDSLLIYTLVRYATNECRWSLVSVGPNGTLDSVPAKEVFVDYDPTNGTLSTGDIVYLGHYSAPLLGS